MDLEKIIDNCLLGDEISLKEYLNDFKAFFSKAVLCTPDKENCFFGANKNSIAIVTKNLYLAAWVFSGENKGLYTVVANDSFYMLNGFKMGKVESVKLQTIYWLHSNIPESISKLINNKEFWNSYIEAAEIVFEAHKGYKFKKDIIRNRKPLSKFLFSKKSNLPDYLEMTNNLERKVKNSMKENLETLERRLDKAKIIPRQITVSSKAFERNPDVIIYTLRRAAGVCEQCKNPAPFKRSSDGMPYLEVHHKIPLSEGGTDEVSNTLALCPNCHRRLHFGQ
ncbi:hypothetical protein CH371_19770 [Leptospira wolffii]|uniref:HNH nuclease domain-containing protein n=1 Tax=Leptospira wolffii TaxID=409998 RepID=A0A2M9Z6R0_9LEPT|nr:HNH endonuclease [Leptospira wolffii]PJZ64105.1 hypothetical protein CH371_19770 [Leptospira wolffii]